MTSNLEPIAIVGLGAYLPGAKSVQEFYRNNRQGICSLTGLPEELKKFFSPERGIPGSIYCKSGGFLEPVSLESLQKFYPISREEFEELTFMQRVVLLTTAETLTSAGLKNDDSKIKNLRAVFSNSFMENSLYTQKLAYDLSQELEKKYSLPSLGFKNISLTPQMATSQRTLGNATLLNRFLNLSKPTLLMDGACASSLVSISMGMDLLRQHRENMVLAGGFCEAGDFLYHWMSSGSALGTEHSVPFDKRADGFIPGNGGALFLLMRLSDAERLGKKIYGVLLNYGASNNESGLIWSTDRKAEIKAIERCYDGLSLSPTDVDYVEAHGTSTVLGDDEEYHALQETYGKNRNNPLHVASVKSMIGHLLQGAGAAGLLRALYAFDQKSFPISVNIKEPRYENDSWFHHQTTQQEWKAETPRRAGVNSFGFGGINYHVLLEEYKAEGYPNGRGAPWRAPIKDAASSVPTEESVVIVGYHYEIPEGETEHPLLFPFQKTRGRFFKSLDLKNSPIDYKIAPKQFRQFSNPKSQKLLDGFITLKKNFPLLFKNTERMGIIGLADPDSCVNLTAANHVQRALGKIDDILLPYLFNETSSMAIEVSSCVSRLALLSGISGFTEKIDGGPHSGKLALEAATAHIQSGRVDTVIIAGIEIYGYLQTEFAKVTDSFKDKTLTDSLVFLVVKSKQKALHDGDSILMELPKSFSYSKEDLNDDGHGLNTHLLKIVRQLEEKKKIIEEISHEESKYSYLKNLAGPSSEEVLQKIKTLPKKILTNQGIFKNTSSREKLCILFPGWGSQMPQALEELENHFSSVKDFLEEANLYLKELGYPSAREILSGNEHRLSSEIDFLQLGVTLTNLGYYTLLTQEWGIRPDMILGHSFGEYPALAAADVISLKEALLLSIERGLALKMNDGALVYVLCSAQDPKLVDILKKQKGFITIANINSPKQIVLSAHNKILDECLNDLRAADFICGRLNVPNPTHTGLNSQSAQNFYDRMKELQINPKPAKFPVFSNVLNDFYPKDLSENTFYSLLSHHMAVSVHFQKTIVRAYESGARCFLECGGRSALSKLTEENLGKDVAVCAVSPTPENSLSSLLKAKTFLVSQKQISNFSEYIPSLIPAPLANLPLADKNSETVILPLGLENQYTPEELCTRYEEIYQTQIETSLKKIKSLTEKWDRKENLRLFLVTNTLKTGSGLENDPRKIIFTTFQGLIRSLKNEYPSVEIRLINFGSSLSSENISAFVEKEKEYQDNSPYVMWIEGKRYHLTAQISFK